MTIMSFIQNYHQIATYMYDRYITLNPESQDPESPEDWFSITNTKLGMQMSALNTIIGDLEKIGAILVCNTVQHPDTSTSEPEVYDKNGFLVLTPDEQSVDYVVLNGNILRNKLIDLNESIAANEEFVDALEQDEAANRVLQEVGGFVAFANGSVLYNDTPLECPIQQKLMLITLLRNHGQTTTYETLKNAIDRPDHSTPTISKYISALRRVLLEQLGYDPLTTEKDVGIKLTLKG